MKPFTGGQLYREERDPWNLRIKRVLRWREALMDASLGGFFTLTRAGGNVYGVQVRQEA